MTKCSTAEYRVQGDLFTGFKRRKIDFDFGGGSVSSDGGVLLLKQADRKLNLLKRVAEVMDKYDDRQKGKIEHSLYSMLVQRIYGIACGYEDLNDHDELRHDIAWQTAAGEVKELASSPTLCRFESMSDRKMCMELLNLMVDVFMESFDSAPGELVLDFDNTDIEVHGKQEGRFFNGYYDHYCFLPLYVFCGEKLVAAFLQPSNDDGSRHAGAILKIIVRKIRAKWPCTKIIYRGDSGFCRRRHLNWCEKNNVDYIVGIAKNNRLESAISVLLEEAEKEYRRTGNKSKIYSRFKYSADSWNGKERDVIGKAEYNEHGKNPRFVVTNLPGDSAYLYEEVYCSRGNAENRIKEQQLGLFAYRASAKEWWTNQFRIILSSLSYILFERIRNMALRGTELASAQAETIRLKLLKIGAVIKRNTRKIYFSLSSSFPYKDIFIRVAETFSSG